VLLKGEAKRAGAANTIGRRTARRVPFVPQDKPALQARKRTATAQDFVAALGSSLGLDGIERVGGRFPRWGLGSRHQRSGARLPGEIEK
jgi:hypothetical protein